MRPAQMKQNPTAAGRRDEPLDVVRPLLALVDVGHIVVSHDLDARSVGELRGGHSPSPYGLAQESCRGAVALMQLSGKLLD